jgi:stress response protein SCP2
VILFTFPGTASVKDTSDYDCYMNFLLLKQNKVKDDDYCVFGNNTIVYTNVTSWEEDIKTHELDNDHENIIIVDNSQFPLYGANSQAELTVMTTAATKFKMTYNIRNILIYVFLGMLVTLIAMLATCYLYMKLRQDTY